MAPEFLGPLAQQCLLQAPSAILVSQQHLSSSLCLGVGNLRSAKPKPLHMSSRGRARRLSVLSTGHLQGSRDCLGLRVHGTRLGRLSHLARLSRLHLSTSEHVEPAHPPRCCKSSKSGANSLLEAIASQHMDDCLEIPDHGFLTACRAKTGEQHAPRPPGNWNCQNFTRQKNAVPTSPQLEYDDVQHGEGRAGLNKSVPLASLPRRLPCRRLQFPAHYLCSATNQLVYVSGCRSRQDVAACCHDELATAASTRRAQE